MGLIKWIIFKELSSGVNDKFGLFWWSILVLYKWEYGCEVIIIFELWYKIRERIRINFSSTK